MNMRAKRDILPRHARTPDSLRVASLLSDATELHRHGRLDEAAAMYREVLRMQPDQFDALHLSGLIAIDRGDVDTGVASLSRAIRIRPERAGPHFNLAVALHRQRRHAEALRCVGRALALKPAYAEAFQLRGAILRALGRHADALDAYDAALLLRPGHAEALNNRGNVLLDLNRAEDALRSFEQALQSLPANAEILSNRGNALRALGHAELALKSYAEALRHKPGYAEAHFNESLCRLREGDFEAGWQKYEWRWQCASFRTASPAWPAPLWQSDMPLRGKTLLLWAEQGFGDTLQFVRYAAQAARLAERVILRVPAPLKRLMASFDGPAQVIADHEAPPPFDFHCPLMSLPARLGVRPDNVPVQRHYLSAAPEDVATWQTRLAQDALAHSPRLRVGLVWAGNARKESGEAALISADRQRSMALSQFADFGKIDGLLFYSLQKGEAGLQAQAPPAGMRLIDRTHLLHDFADTAALITVLDLVVSVDTAVAHLAGALGKPVWLMNRFDGCWRWLRGRTDTPWYPAMRLFNQPQAGDWTACIREAAAMLRQKAEAP